MSEQVGEKRTSASPEAVGSPSAKKVIRPDVLPRDATRRVEGTIYTLKGRRADVMWWKGRLLVVSGDKTCVCEHGNLSFECCQILPPKDSYMRKIPLITNGPGTSGRTYYQGQWLRVVEGLDKNPLVVCIHGGRILPCATCGEEEKMCCHEHVFARCAHCTPFGAQMRTAYPPVEEELTPTLVGKESEPVPTPPSTPPFIMEEEEDSEVEVHDRTNSVFSEDSESEYVSSSDTDEDEEKCPVSMDDPSFDWDMDFCPTRHQPEVEHPWWNPEDQRRICRDYEAKAKALGWSDPSNCPGLFRNDLNGFPFISEVRKGKGRRTICPHGIPLASHCSNCLSFLRCIRHGIPRAFCSECTHSVCVHGLLATQCSRCRSPCPSTRIPRFECSHCTALEEALPLEIRRTPLLPYMKKHRVEGRKYRKADAGGDHGWNVGRWIDGLFV